MSTLAVEKRNVAQEMTPPRWLFRVIFVCFYLSGTAGLIYQVSWMKALGLLFGRTTYAITAVLGPFMAGLALGSWLLGRYAERARHPLRFYGWIELGIALTGLGTLAGIWLTQGEFNRNAELRHSMSTYLSVEEPVGLLGYYIWNDAAVRQFAAHADLNTDDRTVLEYRTPFNILKETNALNHSIVRCFRQETLPSFVDVEYRNAALLAAAGTQVCLGMLTHPQGAPLVAEALGEVTKSERTLMLHSGLALEKARRIFPASPEIELALWQAAPS